jgi:hypothetical protein
LDEKEGGANVDGEQPIEIFNGGIFDGGGFRDSGISDKDIEAIADDVAREFGKLVRPIGSLQIGRDCVAAAAGFAYLADDFVGFIGATAVMHQDLSAGSGERECTGAADAARRTRDKRGFARELFHDRFPYFLDHFPA